MRFPLGRPKACQDCPHTSYEHDREPRADEHPGAVAVCQVCSCRTTKGFVMMGAERGDVH